MPEIVDYQGPGTTCPFCQQHVLAGQKAYRWNLRWAHVGCKAQTYAFVLFGETGDVVGISKTKGDGGPAQSTLERHGAVHAKKVEDCTRAEYEAALRVRKGGKRSRESGRVSRSPRNN